MPPGKNQGKNKKESGFNLTEMVFAIAIATMVMVTVVGMLPVGLRSLRGAIDHTIEAQIVRQITAEMLLTPFGTIPVTYNNATMYFDGEGQRVLQTNEARYLARISLTTSSYPDINPVPVSSLITINADIVNSIIPNNALASSNRYTISIANNGY